MRFRLPTLVLVLALGASLVAGVPASAQDDGQTTLTLLHNNDGESSLRPLTYTVGEDGTELQIGSVAAFKAVTDREIASARAAGNSVLDVYAGDSFLASAALACSLPPKSPETPIYDAVAQAQIPYDAHIFGNHEFDYGPAFLSRFVWSFAKDGALSQPFLSANLNFRPERQWRPIIVQNGLIVGKAKNDRVVARSAIINDGGQRFGIVGSTTWILPTISSPGKVQVTADLATTAAAVQKEINRLMKRGINRIILVSHLQDVDNDKALLTLLHGVDIAVAGGGDELLASDAIADDTELLPGETQEIEGSYPAPQTDADGRTVYMVTTAGNYKYLGRLDAVFGADGEVASIDAEASYPRRVIPTEQSGTQITDLGIADAVASDPGIISSVIEPVKACLAEFEATALARSEVVINVSRGSAEPYGLGVRSGETNGGDLVTDAFLAEYDKHAASVGLPARDGTNLVIAVQNGGGIRQGAGNFLPQGGTAGGAISRLDTLNVLAFDNYLVVVLDITTEQLRTILERSCESIGGGQFLQVAALSLVCDTTRDVGSRVHDVVFTNGTAEADDDVILVDASGTPATTAGSISIVTNQFTANGGDDYPTFAAAPRKQLTDASGTPIFYEQALREYLASFPVAGEPALPTIPALDTRYATETGEGRITLILPEAAPPSAAPGG